MAKKKLTILVSSTVYGIEELLERIYTLLTGFGYEVWMSHEAESQDEGWQMSGGEMVKVPEKVRKERLRECSACWLLSNGVCSKCACVTRIKASLADHQCPVGRWEVYNEEKE